MRVLRVSCFQDFYRKAQLAIVVLRDDGTTREQRYEFDDVQQLLAAVDKMRLVANDMLRHAPRPEQEAR